MKKQIVATVALATLGLGTSVSAKETVEVVKPVEEVKTDAVDTKEIVVAESDVKEAKESLDASKSAVNAQESVVASAETFKTDAETNVADKEKAVANAEAIAIESTPEVISGVEKEINVTEAKLVSSDEEIAKTETALVEANKVAEEQAGIVSSVQADVNAKTEAVKTTESNVATAQAVLDGTNQADLVTEADNAKLELESATNDLTTKEAKETDKTRDAVLSEWSGKKEETKAILDEKQGLLTTATEKVEKAVETLMLVESELANAEGKLGAVNTIKMTPEYITALNDYIPVVLVDFKILQIIS